MDIITRNFLRLLCSGVFGASDAIEPMSTWKWGRLYQLSLMHSVSALIYDGIKAHQDEFYMRLTPEQRSMWENTLRQTEEENKKFDKTLSELFTILNNNHLRPILMKGQGMAAIYDHPLHRKAGNIDIFFPFGPQAKKADQWAKENGEALDDSERQVLCYQWQGVPVKHHRRMQRLSNTLLNHYLQEIIENEIHTTSSSYVLIENTTVETVPPTLNLLLMLTRIIRYMMSDGVSLKQLTDLGVFLRKDGDKVDYVKVQDWLDTLQMSKMAQLTGALLVNLFRFEEDEIPFMADSRLDTEQITREIFCLKSSHPEDWYAQQGASIFQRSSAASAITWQTKHSAKYFRYYPGESFASLIHHITHSLSHIEE